MQKSDQLQMRSKVENSEKRLTSNVWLSFNEIVDKSNNKVISNFVECIKCNSFAQYNGISTTQLLRHVCLKKQRNLDFFLSKNKCEIAHEDKAKITNACVKFISKDLRPYYAVEGEGLIDLLKSMVNIGRKYSFISDSDIEKIIPSRNTVKSYVEKYAQEMISNVKKYFQCAIKYPGGFSCTTDLWSDDQKQITYICITAHINLIENNAIKSKRLIIHLDQFDAMKKTADLLRNEIIEVFEKFEISHDDIEHRISFVTDRGPNIKAALARYERIYCFAHIINNIVEAMCKPADIKKLVSDAAYLVKFMKMAGLNSKCNPTLKSYCKTRWNTVYLMLRSIYSNYSTILGLLNEKEQVTNGSENYVEKLTILVKFKLKNVIDFLKLFKDMTDDIEGDKYVTLHYVLPLFEKLRSHLRSEDDDVDIIEEMKNAGREYIHKNLNEIKPTLIHKLSSFLHPMFKSLRMCSIVEKIEVESYVRALIEKDVEISFPNIVIQTNTGDNNVINDSELNVTSYLDEYVDDEENFVRDTDELSRYKEIKTSKVSKFKI